MANGESPRLFVSHHSSKAEVADHVERALTARGVRCWIAPRDIPPGEPFDRSVHRAIVDCDAMLLLFCSQSEKSRHIKRELILADDLGKSIIPLRLERIDPVELSYHLADSQWIDWMDRRDWAMDRIAERAHFEHSHPHARKRPPRFTEPPPADAPAPQAPAFAAAIPPRNPRKRAWIPWAIGGAALAIIAIVIALIALWPREESVEEWFLGRWSFTRDCRDPAIFERGGRLTLADGTRGRWRIEDGPRLVGDFAGQHVEIDFDRVGENEIYERNGPNPGPAYRCMN